MRWPLHLITSTMVTSTSSSQSSGRLIGSLRLGERSCHCPPPINPLCAISVYKDFGPLLPHLKALCNCMRDSTPLWSSAVACKGSLLVPLIKNLNQKNAPRAHSFGSELENGVLLSTPSLPHDGWLPCTTIGECCLINGKSPGHLVPHCALDLTPATTKSLQPGACRCCLHVWSKSFSLSNYPSLHLFSHWSMVFCKAFEAPLAIIARRARPRQTSGVVMSSMNSLNKFRSLLSHS